MSDLIDRAREKLLSRQADDDIQRQKHELLKQATERVEPLIERQVRSRIEEFSEKIAPKLIFGPDPDPTGKGYLRVRVQKMPFQGFQFKFHTGRIEIRRFTQRSIEDSLRWTEDSIQIKVDFNVEPWFEYKGEKLVTIEEVVEILLSEVLDAAIT